MSYYREGLIIEAARLCRDEYCRLLPGKRTWSELTEQERDVDVKCLRAACDYIALKTAERHSND